MMFIPQVYKESATHWPNAGTQEPAYYLAMNTFPVNHHPTLQNAADTTLHLEWHTSFLLDRCWRNQVWYCTIHKPPRQR